MYVQPRRVQDGDDQRLLLSVSFGDCVDVLSQITYSGLPDVKKNETIATWSFPVGFGDCIHVLSGITCPGLPDVKKNETITLLPGHFR